MSDSTFGHHANEWEGPPPLPCPLCGQYHERGLCPLDDGPTHVPGEEPEDQEWDPGPEPPHVAGSGEHPAWCYGEPAPLDPDDDRPAYTYRNVCERSPN